MLCKNSEIERVMIFIELVNGCNNTACPSYKTLCSLSDNPIQFMSKETLSSVVADILENEQALRSIGRVDIWAYGCGDTLLHPELNEMCDLLKLIPFKKTVAIDSNCWRDDIEYGKTLSPVILFKEGSFDIKSLPDIAKKWSKNFSAPRFGFILKTLTQEMVDGIRSIQPWWNYPFAKIRSFHHTPLGENINYKTIDQYIRPEIKVDEGIKIEKIENTDKKAIRVMYRNDGTLRRCLVSTTEKKTLSEFLEGDLSDCARCWPYMAGEQLLIFPDKILCMDKSRCVSDKP